MSAATFAGTSRPCDEKRISEPITFALRGGPPMTVLRRKLAAHILLHEIRHFAQIAYAVRVAGHEPPGEHDYFFAPIDQWPRAVGTRRVLSRVPPSLRASGASVPPQIVRSDRSNTPVSRFFLTRSHAKVLPVHRDVDARRQHLRE